MKNIIITVTGEVGSGKSTIAAIIGKALKDVNIPVEYVDDDIADKYESVLRQENRLSCRSIQKVSIYSR